MTLVQFENGQYGMLKTPTVFGKFFWKTYVVTPAIFYSLDSPETLDWDHESEGFFMYSVGSKDNALAVIDKLAARDRLKEGTRIYHDVSMPA